MRKLIFAFTIFPVLASAQTQKLRDSIEDQTLNEVVVERASQYTSANKTGMLHYIIVALEKDCWRMTVMLYLFTKQRFLQSETWLEQWQMACQRPPTQQKRVSHLRQRRW